MNYSEILSEYTVDELKDRITAAARMLPGKFVSRGNKSTLIQNLVESFSDVEICKAFYNKLSVVEQGAIQEVTHGWKHLYADRMVVKYGKSPRLEKDYYSFSYQNREPINAIACLFSKERVMPKELSNRFATFVPKPKVNAMNGLENVPEKFKTSMAELDITIHETEQAALADILTMLRLCENGQISASEATGYIAISSAEKVKSLLFAGDFYNNVTERKYDVQMGQAGIRPVAWPLILRVARAVKNSKGKLQLSQHGTELLAKLPHDIIGDLWMKWVHNDEFNEFSRIDAVKGQKSSKRPLNSPEQSREAIVEALINLPIGKWVSIDDFCKFILCSDLHMEVARNADALYVGHSQEHGSLGYNNAIWFHIEGRFVYAVLLEYAATLGLIDVALTVPWKSAEDIRKLYCDDLTCLSRYDGLKYIRLNNLGAYVLKRAETYTPSVTNRASQFQILPNLEVTLLSDKLLTHDRLLLERFCVSKSDRVWQISKGKILNEIERGVNMESIRTNLRSLAQSEQLPDNVEVFLNDICKKSSSLIIKGMYTLIECEDAKTAMLLANDKELRKFTFLVNEKHLMVMQGYEDAFRRNVKKQGLVLPV